MTMPISPYIREQLDKRRKGLPFDEERLKFWEDYNRKYRYCGKEPNAEIQISSEYIMKVELVPVKATEEDDTEMGYHSGGSDFDSHFGSYMSTPFIMGVVGELSKRVVGRLEQQRVEWEGLHNEK